MKAIHVFTVFLTPSSFFDGQFSYLSKKGYDIIMICGKDENAFEFARRNCIRYIPLEIPRSLSPVRFFQAILGLIRIFKDNKPDIVFGHTPVAALCSMVAAWVCRSPKRVYYRHGVIYTTMTGIRRWLFIKEEQFVSWLASDVINVSPSLSRLALEDKLDSRDKQHLIGKGTCGGIDALSRFNPALINPAAIAKLRSDLNIDSDCFICGFCGRICNDKGIPELVDGFESFCATPPGARSKLVLIGAFDERDLLSNDTIAKIKNNDSIIVTGWVDKELIPFYLSLLDVFVFPSHREGFGMSVIEASAMEKPVLVSRSHGCIDSIIEHLTGEYIDLTPESICHGLVLLQDSDLRERLGRNGREEVLKNYDYSVMWPKVNNLYIKLIGDSSNCK